jgi:hypothetical protein
MRGTPNFVIPKQPQWNSASLLPVPVVRRLQQGGPVLVKLAPHPARGLSSLFQRGRLGMSEPEMWTIDAMWTLLNIAIGTLAVFGVFVFVSDRVERNKFVATLTSEQRRRLRAMRWGTWRDAKSGITRLDGSAD